MRYFKICIYDIPRFLAEVPTMFFGTLVGKRSSRWLPALWRRKFCFHLCGTRIDKTEGGITKSLRNVGNTELNYAVLRFLLLFFNLGSVSRVISTQQNEVFLYVFLILVLLELLLETFFCKKNLHLLNIGLAVSVHFLFVHIPTPNVIAS